MPATLLHLLKTTGFPVFHRSRKQSLLVNLGYVYNQTFVHCYMNTGSWRQEMNVYDEDGLCHRVCFTFG